MKSVVKLIREFILAGFLPKIAKIVTKSVMNILGSREMHPLKRILVRKMIGFNKNEAIFSIKDIRYIKTLPFKPYHLKKKINIFYKILKNFHYSAGIKYR
jgi:hypothetical protein